MSTIEERLERIEQTLQLLVSQKPKDWYTTTEAAKILGRAKWTVRDWCRNERLNAEKLSGGRGGEGEYRISHEEIERYQREGLLPDPRPYRHPR
jgi:excisionase family DNA binding protein